MVKKLSAYRTYIFYSGMCSLFSSMIFTVTMVYQVEVIHLTPLQLVLAGTIFEVVNFVFEIPTGIVADIYSRRLSIVIGVIVTGSGFVLQGMFPTYTAVLLSQILWGIGSTFTSGAVEAWIAEEDKCRELNSVFLNGAQAGQLGSVVGIITGAALGNFSLALPIYLGGSLLIALGIFLVLLMPENNFSTVAPEELETFKKMVFIFKEGIKIIRKTKVLILLLLVALFHGLASEGYDRLSTAHFLRDTELPRIWNLKPVTWFGLFGIAGMMLSIIFMQLIIKKWRGSSDRKSISILLVTNILYAICMIVFGITGNFSVMIISYLALNMLRAINRPIISALSNSYIDSKVRATVLSTNGQINSLGEILGGPLIGLIANRFSISIGITSTVIFLIPVIAVYYRMRIGVEKT